MKAIRSMVSELSAVFSTSRNKRRLKLSQPKLRSTGQRFFSGTKPRLLSGFYGPPLRCNLHFPAVLPLNVLNKTDFIAMISGNVEDGPQGMPSLALVVYNFFNKFPLRIGQLLDGFVHNLDNLAISRYDRFSNLSYPKHSHKRQAYF